MIYLFLAPGFEEVEALAPLDLLRRAGLAVTTVAITTPAGIPATECAVTGSHRITVMADMSEADFAHYMDIAGEDSAAMPIRAVILPGGMPGATHLDASAVVDVCLAAARRQGAVIGAICAAPLVLGRRGYLNGLRATCYPGFESELKGAQMGAHLGAHLGAHPGAHPGGKVIRDGNIITAAGMGVSLEFGYELIGALVSPEKAGEIRAAIQSL